MTIENISWSISTKEYCQTQQRSTPWPRPSDQQSAFPKGYRCTGKQRGSHKSCPLCTKWPKIYLVYPDPLKQDLHQFVIKYSPLSLSQGPRDALKYFEISVPRHIRFAELRKKINRTTTFHKWINNLMPEFRDILKILWKRGEIAPLFHNILLPIVRISCQNRDQIFTSR